MIRNGLPALDHHGTGPAGWEEKMGLIPVTMMKWMENLNVFLGRRDRREVNPLGSIEIGTFPLQKMKGS